MDDSRLLADQVAYYRARALEYDQWFLREGRYDRGPEHRAEWFTEVATIETAARETMHRGEVLELACGTGLWTRHLAAHNVRVVAVDASPEVIAINRDQLGATNVDYIVADLFSWTPSTRFDTVFFSFWLSHIPPARLEAFWATVRKALKPNGQAFFVDSLLEQSSTARDHAPLGRSGVVRRRLNDGREFEIVKVFYEPAALERKLSELGWRGWVRSSGKFFCYGAMTPDTSLYDIEVTTIEGRPIALEAYRKQTLLIVNVASQCGFTPQYAGLEALYRRHKSEGVLVLGFPCDQFGHQEPAGEAEIKRFCADNYDVTFPLFAKIDVNGPNAHPLYRLLKSAKKGLLGSEAVKWNFTKFLVSKDGDVLRRYGPTDTPEAIEKDLARLLTEGEASR